MKSQKFDVLFLESMAHRTLIISLGGSLIIPDHVSEAFLLEFQQIIHQFIAQGNRCVIICGGGHIAREYQHAVLTLNTKVEDTALDWLGIHLTRVNAELVRLIFEPIAAGEIMRYPRQVQKHKEAMIVGGGWKPGFSTDYVAVKCAQYLDVKEVINLSNVAYIYDKDPKQHKHAQRLLHLSWKEMKALVGTTWTPGAHLPFDPRATALGAKLKLKVIFLSGAHMDSLKAYLHAGIIEGSIIEGDT